MCHYRFQIIKIRCGTWTFCAYVSVIIISDRCWGRHERSADSSFETFVSTTHFMVSTHKVRGKPFPEPSRKTEVPSVSVQTKINNQRTSPKHIPFPENGLNVPVDSGLQRSIFCHLGAIDWRDWVLDELIVITEVRPSSGIRTVTGHQSLSVIVLSLGWLLLTSWFFFFLFGSTATWKRLHMIQRGLYFFW